MLSAEFLPSMLSIKMYPFPEIVYMCMCDMHYNIIIKQLYA